MLVFMGWRGFVFLCCVEGVEATLVFYNWKFRNSFPRLLRCVLRSGVGYGHVPFVLRVLRRAFVLRSVFTEVMPRFAQDWSQRSRLAKFSCAEFQLAQPSPALLRSASQPPICEVFVGILFDLITLDFLRRSEQC